MGSARSRWDGIGTVGTGEAAGTMGAVVDGVGRSRGTHGGVLIVRDEGREGYAVPESIFYIGGELITGCCRCSSTGRRLRRGWSSKKGRDRHGRTGGRCGVDLLCGTR